MFFNRKKIVSLIALLAVFVMGGGVVYALTSNNFSARAQSWANTTCTQSLLNSKSNTTNNLNAAVCYNYLKNNDQDTLLSNQQQQISGLSSLKSKQLVAYDANGVRLGLLVVPFHSEYGGSNGNSIGGEVFNENVNSLVDIGQYGNLGVGVQIAFDGANCDGNAYYVTNNNQTNINLNYGHLLTDGNGNFYTMNANAQQNILLNSALSGSTCNSWGSIQPAVPLTKVSLPFPGQIALPLSNKYE